MPIFSLGKKVTALTIFRAHREKERERETERERERFNKLNDFRTLFRIQKYG